MRPEDSDTEFVWADFEVKINNELASNLGNFINRVVSLNDKFFEGKKATKNFSPLKKEAEKLLKEYVELMEKSRERDALMKANEISSLGNKFLQDNEPWNVAKTDIAKAGEIIAESIDLFKLLSCVYHPFIPSASKKIAKMVDFDFKEGFEAAFNEVKEGTLIKNIGILFEKLEKIQVEELRNKFSGKK
jgi:methionyl-tRNA synthetase